MLDDKREYVVVLQSYQDKNAENVKYLKFGKSWKRGEWVNTVNEATFVSSKDQAEKIAWYWGVTFKEVL